MVQHNIQHYRQALLSCFHCIAHTLGFHPQTQKLEPSCTAEQTVPRESTAQ